jgi:signal transduction histidine kinase
VTEFHHWLLIDWRSIGDNLNIDQMLFLSRAESNAIAFDLQTVNPTPFLEMFAHDAEALAEHSGQRFVLETRGRGMVRIEASWLRQVMLNLVSNALSVSPPGGVVRMVSSIEGRHWRVTIEDEGPGLAAEDCERIFERFVRIGRNRNGDRGAGLGLSIARTIVTLHDGSILAESKTRTQGLRVIVELPTTEIPAAPAPLPSRA